jgi:hypothetical protein
MLQQAYGEDCLSRTQCYEWYQRFKAGRTSIEDDPKSGRPSSSTGDDQIEKMRSVIRGNRRLCHFWWNAHLILCLADNF